MSNQVTPLEAALARAEEAETNMKLAAQYGQELLEKMNKSEKMQVQLEQERHNLKLQLQSKESEMAKIQGAKLSLCVKETKTSIEFSQKCRSMQLPLIATI